MPFNVLLELPRETIFRREFVNFAISLTYDRLLRLAETGRGFHQCLEHGLEVEGRATDHLE
jgi:hypothetical protein